MSHPRKNSIDSNKQKKSEESKIEKCKTSASKISALGTMFLQMFSFLKSTPKPLQNAAYKKSTSQKEYSVYCIHGTADRSASFETMIKKLNKKELPGNIKNFYFPSFDERGQGRSIENFASQLKQIIQKNNDKNVILLGHSRGGLVASYFTEYYAKKANINVDGVITFGTPFGGADSALFPLNMISTSVDQMRPNSHFLKELGKKVEVTNRDRKIYHFFGAECDSIVAPHKSFVHKNLHYGKILENHTHLSMLRSGTAARMLSQILTNITTQPTSDFVSEVQVESHVDSSVGKSDSVRANKLLETICDKYLIHLKDFNENFRDAELTNQKIDIMEQLLGILDNKNKTPDERLKEFSKCFNGHYEPSENLSAQTEPKLKQPPLTCRQILEKRRDSIGRLVVKYILTVLSLGILAAVGMWKKEGKKVAKEISSSLRKTG